MLAEQQPSTDSDIEPIIFTEDDMGESDIQFAICDSLVEQLTDLLHAWGIEAKVGGNLQFRYDPEVARAQVTPDVYVLRGVPTEVTDVSSWATWERGGKAPSLAIEIVSKTSKKDYAQDESGMLARYQRLGVAELVRYDPLWSRASRQRRLLTHWVRSQSGELVEQKLMQPNLLRLMMPGVLLMHVGRHRGWLRLAISNEAEISLWPTRLERIKIEAARAEAEAARAEAEAARAEAEAARAEALQEELDRLKQRLSSGR